MDEAGTEDEEWLLQAEVIKAAFTEFLVSSRRCSKHPECTSFTDGGKGVEGKVQGFGRTKGVRAERRRNLRLGEVNGSQTLEIMNVQLRHLVSH